MERRALYHSLRVNWQLDASLRVKPWQVEDYRMIPSEELFARLEKFGVRVDYAHFLALSESEETPEDFAETLLPDDIEEQEEADQIYLIVFELWRRFLSERQTLSLFCDEWDHQIDLYESGTLDSLEGLGDVISRFETLLEVAEDQNEDPKALYTSVIENCAHDVEAFLYDFTSGQIEDHNFSYAEEIIECFTPYVKDKHWFQLLNLEVLTENDPDEALHQTHVLIKEIQGLDDLEFYLEFLAFLAKNGDEKAFLQIFKLTLPKLQIEEDFWDLLSSCEDFFHYKDLETNEEWIKLLRARRFKMDPNSAFTSQDPELKELQKLF